MFGVGGRMQAMDTQPSGGTNASEPEPIKEFRGQGWSNVWGVLLAVFLGLVCACVYWIIRLGFRGALDNAQFKYEAFFAAVLGVCLIGRWSVPYLLLNASTIDRRNAGLMNMSRSGWFFRRSFRRKP
jgi:hypothetical protein